MRVWHVFLESKICGARNLVNLLKKSCRAYFRHFTVCGTRTQMRSGIIGGDFHTLKIFKFVCCLLEFHLWIALNLLNNAIFSLMHAYLTWMFLNNSEIIGSWRIDFFQIKKEILFEDQQPLKILLFRFS